MKKEYVAPKIEKLNLTETACGDSSILSSNEDDNGDVGRGLGSGGGCDKIPGHGNQKSFSSPKKGCY